MLQGAKMQTLFLTGINAIVRALGLAMRMVLSRMLGAELMGITELAQSVHMIAITPLTSGIPAAVSRLTAKASRSQKDFPLIAGIRIVRLTSLLLVPLLWLSSPLLAKLIGDIRVLPSIWFSAPCILVLGYSAVYNGYCYGMEQSFYPAFSELIEQICRLLFTFALVSLLPYLSAPWMAAIPVSATLFAEIIGLFYVMAMVRLPHNAPREMNAAAAKELIHLSVPTTLSRLIQTLLRSITALLIPLRLQHSGLPVSEATSRLGMLNGMVMPILMLPCVFTSAISMVSMPKLAKAEEKPGEFRRILGLSLSGVIPVALLSMAGVYLFAPFLSLKVYRIADLTELFRLCAPMTLLFALNHLAGSVLSALGQQKRTMFASAAISSITLLVTWILAGLPSMRLRGVVIAMYAGQLLSLFSSFCLLWWWRKSRHAR